jgi:hypothetical protein
VAKKKRRVLKVDDSGRSPMWHAAMDAQKRTLDIFLSRVEGRVCASGSVLVL